MVACWLAYMGPFPKSYRFEKFMPLLHKMLSDKIIKINKEATLEDVIGN